MIDQQQLDHVHFEMKQNIKRYYSLVSFVNDNFLRLMLKHRIDDASSCFMIIYDQDEIINIKKSFFEIFNFSRNN